MQVNDSNNNELKSSRAPLRIDDGKFWQIALFFLAIIVIACYNMLLPFVVGILIAYFLNPIIEMLSKLGISRLWGTILITIFVLLTMVIVLTILLPVISWQLQQFVTKAIPVYIDDLQRLFYGPKLDWLRKLLNIQDINNVRTDAQNLFNPGSDITKTIMSSILSSGKSIVGGFSLFIIAPVVAFYLLLDWDYLVLKVDSLVPRRYLCTFRQIAKNIDRAVAGFVRGQSAVCLILGIYYIIALSLCNLNYAVLLGLYVGVASFIPYIGSFSGFVISLIVAWAQFYQTDWYYISIVVGVFLFGHFIESYVLQPKLVGNSVGLHPVWLMFALFSFGYLFGFLGMIIAVPLAAAIGVLVRFGIDRYMKSPLYLE